MAVSVYEIQGRDVDDRMPNTSDAEYAFRRLFRIEGTTDELTARNALISNTSAAYNGFPVTARRVREVAPSIYEGEVEYSNITIRTNANQNLRQTPSPGTWRISATGATSTQHITHGTLVSSTGSAIGNLPGAPSPGHYRGAINVNLSDPDKPEVDGTDIVVPTLAIRVEFGFHAYQFLVSPSLWRQMMQHVGKTNSATFLQFQPGEVLCTGFDTSYSQEDDPEVNTSVSFDFEVSENKTNIKLGSIPNLPDTPQITVPNKRGWDYLTVISTPAAAEGELATYPALVQADVVRIYEEIDHNQLFGYFTV